MTDPSAAVDQLAQQLSMVEIESLSASQLVGRVLAHPILADRDSPAADVSAMDGYALRMSDLQRRDPIDVSGESAAGSPPPSMPENHAVRIFTGAIVPAGCETIVKREDTQELDSKIQLLDSARDLKLGQHIRRAGENAVAGSTVLESGKLLSAAQLATMANFGAYDADVFARVRVTVITTGDEVGLFKDSPPEAWQLRNSNQVSVRSVLSPHPWIDARDNQHAKDDRDVLLATIQTALQNSDAVLLTGGVSMGDYDFVPDVVQALGGNIIFHGLPVRPGKPILGAAMNDGKLIVGLPGNPVSATIGCHRFALPLLAKMSGQTPWLPKRSTVRLVDAGEKTIPLHWMRLVTLTDEGVARPVPSKGSGDLVSLGQSTGYVVTPPGQSGEGPWPYFSW